MLRKVILKLLRAYEARQYARTSWPATAGYFGGRVPAGEILATMEIPMPRSPEPTPVRDGLASIPAAIVGTAYRLGASAAGRPGRRYM